MRQPDTFICISYSQIDFLIPNEYVLSAVGVKDIHVGFMHNENSGIFDFDDVAAGFSQYPRPTHVKTLIVIKDGHNNQISIVTTQECKVCQIPLKNFRLLSDCYADSFKQLGILACTFENNRMRVIVDVMTLVDYSNDRLLEEL